MKIGFGCDHAAVDLKDKMIAYMKEKGYEIDVNLSDIRLRY